VTLFEYLAIAYGLLFSLAALRILGGLPYAVEKARRYWVHLAMTLVLLLAVIGAFWTLWSLRDIRWTFSRFLLVLTIPGILYYLAALAIPENPEQVESWGDHYYTVHRRFFAGFALWGAVAAVNASVNLGLALTHPSRAVHATAMIFGVVGAASSSPRVHAGIATLAYVAWALWALTTGMSPGGGMNPGG
jgi:hypothetical protein